jgi:hypothetical protein
LEEFGADDVDVAVGFEFEHGLVAGGGVHAGCGERSADIAASAGLHPAECDPDGPAVWEGGGDGLAELEVEVEHVAFRGWGFSIRVLAPATLVGFNHPPAPLLGSGAG